MSVTNYACEAVNWRVAEENNSQEMQGVRHRLVLSLSMRLYWHAMMQGSVDNTRVFKANSGGQLIKQIFGIMHTNQNKINTYNIPIPHMQPLHCSPAS